MLTMNFTNNLRLVILAFLLISIVSCDSTTEDYTLKDQGYDYFPLEDNSYWIYQVDSIVYANLGDRIDTTSSYLREEITDVYIDQVSDTIFVIERSFSPSLSDNWRVTDVWAASKSEFMATRTEENLKYVKLIFPVEINNSWDGNAFLDPNVEIFVKGESIDLLVDRWDYRVLDIADVDTIGGIQYNDVATIQNIVSSEDEFINYRYVIEKYSKGVGLVYKNHYMLDTNCGVECDTIPWTEKAEKGYIMEQKLLEYGK